MGDRTTRPANGENLKRSNENSTPGKWAMWKHPSFNTNIAISDAESQRLPEI